MRNPDNKDFYWEDLVMDLDNSDVKAETIKRRVRQKQQMPGLALSPKEDEGEDC